ncbi:tyrosine-type recombinase/integrase [Streptosporangium sp. NPDC048047]|uniref:tyrosine-type recombinase/integrase n=1 Tax=Streptosporangium sp. NPDC048047 TaxID=3155748 RepID=UPI00343B79F4
MIRRYTDPKEGPKPTEPLSHARLHDLRHIHATTLLLAGVPVHVVAARLGHAGPSITLRVHSLSISLPVTLPTSAMADVRQVAMGGPVRRR